MRISTISSILLIVGLTACRQGNAVRQNSAVSATTAGPGRTAAGDYVGFDRNMYPGDARLAGLRQHFAFVGYWLNNPPGETENSWAGKRQIVRATGFGFLVLYNGRLDADIKRAELSPSSWDRKMPRRLWPRPSARVFQWGRFCSSTRKRVGRLLPEQAGYFFGWTEAVAASAYKPGAYLSGQPSADGTGPDGKPATVTTAQDVRETVAARHLHAVAFWVAQDACAPAGPSTGCTLQSPALKTSGTQDALAWQYAQSPRRPEITKGCAKTYGDDGNCYAGVSADLFLDLDVASSADPSRGR